MASLFRRLWNRFTGLERVEDAAFRRGYDAGFNAGELSDARLRKAIDRYREAERQITALQKHLAAAYPIPVAPGRIQGKA